MSLNLRGNGRRKGWRGLRPASAPAAPNFGVVQLRHLRPEICGDTALPALEAGLRVARAGAAGQLPVFAATLGMPPSAFRRLLRREAGWLLPEVPDEWLSAQVPPHFMTLVLLLLEFRGADGMAVHCLARAIAAACFGDRHLWQDMGFCMRDELSALIAQCFPRLYALNTRNLKWKRFLFMLLGERIGQPGLLPPACPRCASYAQCFGAGREGHLSA